MEINKKILICIKCGKEFVRTGHAQKQCEACRKATTQKANSKPKVKKCDMCGKEFVRKSNSQKRCKECQDKVTYKYNGQKDTNDKPNGRRNKKLTLSEIGRLAKAEGLTYGQYVTKYKV